jgi:hypothetical protein
MAIKTIKLPGGETVEIDEWLHYPIFSVIEWAAAQAVDLRAFGYVVGQRVPQQGIAARNATESDTNQVTRARMNHDESFVAFSTTYEVFGLSAQTAFGSPPIFAGIVPFLMATNLKRLQRDLICELYIGAGIRKPQFRSPFSWIGQGVGSPAWGTGDAVAANVRPSYGTGGEVTPRNQRRWNLPIFIESDRMMSYRVFSPVGAITGLSQHVRLRIYLDGLKRRPVA